MAANSTITTYITSRFTKGTFYMAIDYEVKNSHIRAGELGLKTQVFTFLKTCFYSFF